MRRARSGVHALLAMLAVAVVVGCDDGKPPVESSTEEATVKGTVTILGKPATKGQLHFDATNIKRPNAPVRTAEIGPNGTYQTTTLVGPNSISVVVPKAGMPHDGMSPELGLDVKPGENTFNIALPFKAE